MPDKHFINNGMIHTHAYQLYVNGLTVTKFGCFELFEMGWIICLWVGFIFLSNAGLSGTEQEWREQFD